VPIRLHGVNQVGHEGGNAGICMNRSLPWLQEVAGHDVWVAWMVTYRDVIILDEQNVTIGVYNLTTNDLSMPQNYAALRQWLLDAAR